MIEGLIDTLKNGAIELITTFISGAIYVVVSLVYIILAPIDELILQYLPDLSNAFTAVADLLNLIGQGIGWAISVSGLSTATITLIVAYYTFKLTAPVLLYMLKLALSWYNNLKS